MIICICSCFFFSSRRRHTRLQGDWSSDVCSSDLLSITNCRRSARSMLCGSPSCCGNRLVLRRPLLLNCQIYPRNGRRQALRRGAACDHLQIDPSAGSSRVCSVLLSIPALVLVNL